MKKLVSIFLAAAMATTIVSCGSNTAPEKSEASNGSASSIPEKAAITLKVASDYSSTNVIGQYLEKWAEAADEKSDGSVEIVVYPDNQLGSKTDALDSLFMGEPVVVGGDPAFLAEYGAPDLGILFGPFLFSSNEGVIKLTQSDWFQSQMDLLEENGLKVIGANWITGTRHLLTNDPVQVPNDMKGMKIRVPTNMVQTESFNAMGASATAMDLSEVYSALQAGTIDGAENPLSTLYDRKLQEVSKQLLLTGHVRVISMWVMSADVWNTLSAEQQDIIVTTLTETGLEYNEAQVQTDAEVQEKMEAEGVTVHELSDEDYQKWVEAAEPFYEMGDQFGWSDGLYETVLSAINS